MSDDIIPLLKTEVTTDSRLAHVASFLRACQFFLQLPVSFASSVVFCKE